VHDNFSIRCNGEVCWGSRYLREHLGKTYQTVFYLNRLRADPVGYARFATDDSAMNDAAHKMLADMVNARAERSAAD
jgi:hypothetical protein